jgi:N-acetylneuraminic acid mutarotase
MAYIGGDQVLLFGGLDGPMALDGETWVYDLSANTWTNKAPAASPSARNSHNMAYLGGDRVLLFGGYDGTYDDETWVYDLSANTWTNLAPALAPSPRFQHAMASLDGGRVLGFGGWDGNHDGETWLWNGFYTSYRIYLPMITK